MAKRHWSQVGIAGKVAEALFLGRPVERHVAAAFYGQPAAFDADGQPLNDAAFADRYWRRHLATVTDILKERREALEARARALMGAAL